MENKEDLPKWAQDIIQLIKQAYANTEEQPTKQQEPPAPQIDPQVVQFAKTGAVGKTTPEGTNQIDPSIAAFCKTQNSK